MKLLGLTGGIGMGKSTASRILRQFGLRVIDTDDIAREVVRPGEPALDEIRDCFGDAVFQADSSLDRARLAERVFGNATDRKRLESILHPRIRAAWERDVGRWREEGIRCGVVVIPLLFETSAESRFDAVICVACSEETQRERLKERGWTEEHRMNRVRAQMPLGEKMVKSDYVVWTDGPVSVHEEQWGRLLAVEGVVFGR